MAKQLDVYFHEKIIGRLEQDDHGDIHFTYFPEWLADPAAKQISYSLPLREKTFPRKECRAFFNGILPEENQRKLIAKYLGISASNDFSMLEKIGGECAGALSFLPVGEKLNIGNYFYQKLDEESLAKTLRELPKRPLLAGEKGIRLSLAGVQDKIAVYVKNNKIYIPLNGAPSTHILKPNFSTFDGVIFNEALCLQLAKKIGLHVANAEVKKVEDIDYLLVERYDRIHLNTSKNTERLHQEDFCQALGIVTANKYQNEGGPSLKQCFDLIRKISSEPLTDINRLINAAIFNFLIGNCDAHGKNFSILYRQGIQLAPLYDLICTIYYKDLDKKMAMKLGGEYHISKINIRNFDKLSEEAQLSKSEVRKRLVELCDAMIDSLPTIAIENRVQTDLVELIKSRCLHYEAQVL